MWLYIAAARAQIAGNKSISSRADLGIGRFVCWNMVMGVIHLLSVISAADIGGLGEVIAFDVIFMIGNFYLYFVGKEVQNLLFKKKSLELPNQGSIIVQPGYGGNMQMQQFGGQPGLYPGYPVGANGSFTHTHLVQPQF